jgi:hypothetical protein
LLSVASDAGSGLSKRHGFCLVARFFFAVSQGFFRIGAVSGSKRPDSVV